MSCVFCWGFLGGGRAITWFYANLTILELFQPFLGLGDVGLEGRVGVQSGIDCFSLMNKKFGVLILSAGVFGLFSDKFGGQKNSKRNRGTTFFGENKSRYIFKSKSLGICDRKSKIFLVKIGLF